MSLRVALVALALVACGPGEPAAPVYELRAVVAPALEALSGAASAPLEPDPGGRIDGGAARVDGGAAREVDLEEILGPLRAGDPHLRALVIEDARALPCAAVAELAPALGDQREPPECRTGVAEILSAHATPEAIEALCAGAESASEPWLRSQCAFQLGSLGLDHVLPRLLLRLKYEADYETAFWLAEACARLGHLAGLEAMFVVWNGTGDEELRARVARRMSELALARGAADPDDLLARWKAGSLAPLDLEPSARLRLEAWLRIRDLGQWDLRTVDDARFVLVHLEAWVVPLLAEALHESEVYVRIHAAQCLERMGPRAAAALTALTAALDEPRTAPAAALALGALGRGSAASSLERVLDGSTDPELRVAAAVSLGTLAAPSSLPSLRRAFDPAQPSDLRQAAAAGLVRIEETPAALAFLLECLCDESRDAGAAELALDAWITLVGQRDPSAKPVLERWQALAPAPGALLEEQEVRQRRTERVALLREHLH